MFDAGETLQSGISCFLCAENKLNRNGEGELQFMVLSGFVH